MYFLSVHLHLHLNVVLIMIPVQDVENDLKRYWMPDDACKQCYECQSRFNIFNRRHHCRVCGRIFCNSCCCSFVPGNLLRSNLQGNLRVCKGCFQIFKEYNASRNTVPEASVGGGGGGGANTSSDMQGTETASLVPTVDVPQSIRTAESPLPSRKAVGDSHNVRTSLSVNVLSPHKSWDDNTSVHSMEMDLSPTRGKGLEFDNPISLRKPSVASEREERLLALHEVHTYTYVYVHVHIHVRTCTYMHVQS